MFRAEAKGGLKYKKARVRDLESLFHSALIRVQKARPEVIGVNVYGAEDYSTSRLCGGGLRQLQ
jgi:hypothetical protein